MTDHPPPDWFDLLTFHLEAGADVAVDEAPVDRFAQGAAEPSARLPGPAAAGGFASPATDSRIPATPSRQTPPPPPAATSRIAPQSPDEAVMAAREAVRGADSLDALKALLDGFDGCALKRTASRLVFADGNPDARVMCVGEAPGRDEDRQGLPFVGRAGRLLDLMLGTIGLDRASVYIANIIPWRPPGNRAPTPQEITICLPFIKRQIELVNPDLLVCLGGQSAQALFGTTEGITRLRGRFMDYETGSRAIRAIAIFHPAYLLRTPIAKRLAWRDLLSIETALGRIPDGAERTG